MADHTPKRGVFAYSVGSPSFERGIVVPYGTVTERREELRRDVRRGFATRWRPKQDFRQCVWYFAWTLEGER